MTFDFCQLISTAPCGTSRACHSAGGSPGTSTMLAEVRDLSLMRGFTGSAMVRPSTVKVYR
ncbi:MAG: hypothetical protein Q8N47_22820 [Bryobacterales bacterium]|nr:hypothetical protein [Bryobacterales bacterium]